MTAARDTLGGAVATAAHLPGPGGERLLAAARAAFGEGMEVSLAVCAGISALTAVLVLITLRGTSSRLPVDASVVVTQATDGRNSWTDPSPSEAP